MKKLIYTTIICLIALTMNSCSNSDDNNGGNDIESKEYIKLKSLDEIRGGHFRYAGIKIGDRKATFLEENSKSCRAHEYFATISSEYYPNLDFIYQAFEKGELGCTQIVKRIPELEIYYSVSTVFLENSLVEDGKLLTTMLIGYFAMDKEFPEKASRLYTSSRVYKGFLEIGFQGEYLRIEDRMSNYQRKDENEKVYLYFKKQ